ncbi:MAG: glyceraldehyde 3-phosphate dehydrogenase [Maribacter sp.]|jgi:glyceraldehyde 3-phosphate dehydrogenase
MPKKIAINGFGRIGRLTLRNLLEDKSVEVVAINDLTDNKTLAYLFKHDSAQGMYAGEVSYTDDTITIDGHEIKAYASRNPADLPWKALGVNTVLECTGVFRTRETASLHKKAGADNVILSAPAKGDGFETIVLGVNDELISHQKDYFSNASCTTNCLAPVVKIIEDNWGLVQGNLTTIHSYTGDQRIQDAPHSDLRRARAAAINIVPTTTGAATALGIVIPSAKGKLFAMAVRVPVITGSLIELTVIVDKDVTVAEINAAFKKESEGAMKGILEYSEAPLVSTDIIGNKHSSIFDSQLTQVSGRLVKIISWYDNEAGYSARLADLAARV